MGAHDRSLEERLWDMSAPGPGGCWLWVGRINHRGYAQMWHPVLRKTTQVHRHSYELFRGPIPDGLVIDHLCRVRRCINPWHLEPVTYRQNTARGLLWREQLGVCRHGHDYASNRQRNGGGFRCRQCNVERKRAARIKAMAAG